MNDVESLCIKASPAVLRFALGLSGDRTRVEDIVSETLVCLLTRVLRAESQTAPPLHPEITRGI